MELIDRTFKTVAKPEGSSTFRLGVVTITSPSYSKEEAPVALIHGTTQYRVIEGRLHIPLPPQAYGMFTQADNEQMMINSMLASEMSNDGYRDLKSRMGKQSDIDLTETDRGHLLRERARAYPIIGGSQYVPSPGPLIDVNIRWGTPQRGDDGRPQGRSPRVTQVTPKDHRYSDYFCGALFTFDRVEEALDFAQSLESDDTSGIPSAATLRAGISNLLPYEPANIDDLQLWVMACSNLHTATYMAIHDFGREGVLATMNLRTDLSRRMGGVDPFFDRILTLANEREYGAFLRPLDTEGLEDSLGPVLDQLATKKENDGVHAPPVQIARKLLALLRPTYAIPEADDLDSEELAAIENFHGPKP